MNRAQLFRAAIKRASKKANYPLGAMAPAQGWLARLLGLLRAQHLLFWTAHWQVRGGEFYGDHLLFERLYGEELQNEIDGLAEKMVAFFGEQSVRLDDQMGLILPWTQRWTGLGDLYLSSLQAEQDFQNLVKRTYDILKRTPSMTLGLDDFLMSMANRHETNSYLLGQRMKRNATRATLAKEARVLKDRDGREYGPRRGLEGPLPFKGGRILYYDRREGAYYDPSTDMYLSQREADRLIMAKEAKTVRDNNGRMWGPRRGLEGPFLYKGGRVLYYDPRERGGTYYDPTTDMFLSHDEAYRVVSGY